jgi:hypothetical protein
MLPVKETEVLPYTTTWTNLKDFGLGNKLITEDKHCRITLT